MPGPSGTIHGQLQVFKGGVFGEHGGFLKFSTDAGHGDVGFAHGSQVQGLTEKTGAAIRPGLAGDHVHHGGFARAVGADDAAQFAGLDVQGQIIEGLEAVKTDGDIF